jgi:hypothetical protein
VAALNTYVAVSEMIRNREKAKLAILKELANKDLSWLEVTDIMSKKYYSKTFATHPFLETLKGKELIEEKEGKYRLVDGKATSEVLSVNQNEIEKILSVEYGNGDLAGQLIEQEKYILGRVLSSGNSISITDLYNSFFDDVDRMNGPFSGYANASYGKKRAKETTKNLVDRGFLKINGSISIPERILLDYLTENLEGILLEFKQVSEKSKQLVEKNRRLFSKIEQFDPSISLEKLRVSQEVRNYIVKAIARIDEKSYSEAIINCYRVSENLAKILFDFLYPSAKNERVKHEDRLKKIWNDEEKEKHHSSGVKVIASLLSVILWYRNKMAAHTEMKPTEEAARITVFSLIQSLIEFDRLGIKID